VEHAVSASFRGNRLSDNASETGEDAGPYRTARLDANAATLGRIVLCLEEQRSDFVELNPNAKPLMVHFSALWNHATVAVASIARWPFASSLISAYNNVEAMLAHLYCFATARRPPRGPEGA
jgi:hypothetical protein